mmetsp:Transcript_62441/g.148714  ORF Transcript_62441/g.148714 Transcript_62441/m.148714 type:complete len:272 (+) Transcript_62441:1565-2380(+)
MRRCRAEASSRTRFPHRCWVRWKERGQIPQRTRLRGEDFVCGPCSIRLIRTPRGGFPSRSLSRRWSRSKCRRHTRRSRSCSRRLIGMVPAWWTSRSSPSCSTLYRRKKRSSTGTVSFTTGKTVSRASGRVSSGRRSVASRQHGRPWTRRWTPSCSSAASPAPPSASRLPGAACYRCPRRFARSSLWGRSAPTSRSQPCSWMQTPGKTKTRMACSILLSSSPSPSACTWTVWGRKRCGHARCPGFSRPPRASFRGRVAPTSGSGPRSRLAFV